MEMWQGARNYDEWLDVPETAAVLRRELKRTFPALRCTVKVQHRWRGSLRVRATGTVDPALPAFLDQFRLLRFDGMTDLSFHHINTVPIDGQAVRIINGVRGIDIEWVPRHVPR